MQIKIDKLVEGGDGLGRLDNNKAVFVPGALKDEIVEISIIKETKSHAKAHLDNIVSASIHRVEPACSYYDECGGCDLQHLEISEQVKSKQELLLNHLERFGKLDLSTIKVEETVIDREFGYRNRVRFHVDLNQKRVGFLKYGSKELIEIKHCPILVDALNYELANPVNILKAARNNMFNNRGTGKYIEVPAFAGDNKNTYGKEKVSINIHNHEFIVNANVFFQSNPKMLEKLIEYVISNVGDGSVMDLYSGVGTFSAFLKEGTISVEKQSDCLTFSKINAPNSIPFTGEVENWGKRRKDSVETIVVDPPRTGLFENVPHMLSSFNAKRIIYVSCNPVTLSRDLEKFSEEGYKVKSVKLFDFYPQTHHMESVVILDRAN
ncbi:MAG: class I SAM-dependent RNA methyltransferase [Spirochaetaceae bacterium]|nr:class I SAM-dependent RNA methyltransferase [Spirochaetaceae bacterium]